MITVTVGLGKRSYTEVVLPDGAAVNDAVAVIGHNKVDEFLTASDEERALRMLMPGAEFMGVATGTKGTKGTKGTMRECRRVEDADTMALQDGDLVSFGWCNKEMLDRAKKPKASQVSIPYTTELFETLDAALEDMTARELDVLRNELDELEGLYNDTDIPTSFIVALYDILEDL